MEYVLLHINKEGNVIGALGSLTIMGDNSLIVQLNKLAADGWRVICQVPSPATTTGYGLLIAKEK